MTEETKPVSPESFVYDTRTNKVFTFRRLNKYVLLRDPLFRTFTKVRPEEFDKNFEGTPPPIKPLLEVL